jgi:hypothetical protein
MFDRAVDAPAVGSARGGRQQPDFFVIPDRFNIDAHQFGQLSDAHP